MKIQILTLQYYKNHIISWTNLFTSLENINQGQCSGRKEQTEKGPPHLNLARHIDHYLAFHAEGKK